MFREYYGNKCFPKKDLAIQLLMLKNENFALASILVTISPTSTEGKLPLGKTMHIKNHSENFTQTRWSDSDICFPCSPISGGAVVSLLRLAC